MIKPKLTKGKAKLLIKRELGLNPTTLEQPSSMNRNPLFPWYELHSGNTRITVYAKFSDSVHYVVLVVAHLNTDRSVTEYFYGDTLEFAAEATELEAAEAFCEKARTYVADDTVFDPMLHRVRKACIGANRKHFGV